MPPSLGDAGGAACAPFRTDGGETLPVLIDKATAALSNARTSAEVLEARAAYDAAKSAWRMARAKRAHDDVLAAVYRTQADALPIEARAKVRLADEYDAAQERGEVASRPFYSAEQSSARRI